MYTSTEKEYMLKAVDATDRIIIIISNRYKIIAANKYAVDIYKTDIKGEFCYEALYNRSHPCKGCPAKLIIKGKTVPKKMHEDSSGFGNAALCFPIFKDKAVDALVMIDISSYRVGKMEFNLQRSNAFLRNLILSSVDGVIASDMTGKIIIFNDAASEISGFFIDDALKNLNIKDVYPGDGAREVMKKLRSEKYFGKGKLKYYRVNLLGKNGKNIPISLNASIVYEGNREVATIGFFHDLRKKFSMEKKLEKVHAQLLQAEKMSSLGKLSAGVAHQLNNPLGSITLFAKLALEDYDLEDGLRDDLERIVKDAKRARDTVRELLEFSRQTDQFMKLYDVNKAILRTLFLLENQPLFQNIVIEKDLGFDIPLVNSDIQQLNHMFMNIILNAVEAINGKGGLKIKTRFTSVENKVCIEISDTGSGIPKDILSNIFDPFFTTKEEGKGTGLGLSIVYSIVKNHRGSIIAQSEPGKGTTFIIKLPVEVLPCGDEGNEE